MAKLIALFCFMISIGSCNMDGVTLLVDFQVMGSGKSFEFDLVDVVLEDGGKVNGLPVKGDLFTVGAIACTGKFYQTEPSCTKEGEACEDDNPCSQNTRCQQTAGGLRCRVGDINKDWDHQCSYCKDERNCCGPLTCPVCVYDNVGHQWQEIISVGTCTQGRCDMRTNNCVNECQPEVGCIPSQRSKCEQ